MNKRSQTLLIPDTKFALIFVCPQKGPKFKTNVLGVFEKGIHGNLRFFAVIIV